MRTEWTDPWPQRHWGHPAANAPSLSIQQCPLQKAPMWNPKHFSFLFNHPISNSPKAFMMPFYAEKFQRSFTKTSSSVERKVKIPSPHSPPHNLHFPYDVPSHSHSVLAINPDMTTTSRQTDITKFNCAVSDPFPSLEQWLPTRSLTIVAMYSRWVDLVEAEGVTFIKAITQEQNCNKWIKA